MEEVCIDLNAFIGRGIIWVRFMGVDIRVAVGVVMSRGAGRVDGALLGIIDEEEWRSRTFAGHGTLMWSSVPTHIKNTEGEKYL